MVDVPISERRGVLRLIARWLARRHYPRIEITGADLIPQTGPVLLCANHPNSLLDPVLLGITARRPVKFLAKAPLFEFPVLGPAIRAVGMVPAFRGRDDARQVRRNFESIDAASKVLAAGHAMGIFPEGESSDAPHVKVVRSGAARIALQAVEQGAVGLKIVPVGITYERKERIRSAVWIQIGRPIDVSRWLVEHDGDVRRARRTLTKELGTRLRGVVVHLNEPEWEPWLGDLEALAALPGGALPRTRFQPLKQRWRTANAINYFLANDRPRAESTAQAITEYREEVHRAGLRVDSAVLRHRGVAAVTRYLGRFLWLALGLVPAVLATLHHIVPFVVTRAVATRFDRGVLTATSSHRLFAGIPIYAVWYAAMAIWMFDYFADWFARAWLVVMPFAGVFALHYWSRARNIAISLWHQLLVIAKPRELRRLRASQANLRDRLMGMSEEYARTAAPPAPELVRSPWRVVSRAVAWLSMIATITVVVWVGVFWIMGGPTLGGGPNLKGWADPELEAHLDADERALVPIIENLERLNRDAEQIQGEFENGTRVPTNQADHDAVRELLRRYLALREALLRIVWKYQGYADVGDERLELRALLVAYGSASVLYEAGLKFVEAGGSSPEMIKKLNEREPKWGIPEDLYYEIRRNLSNPANRELLELAQADYTRRDFGKVGLRDPAPYRLFHDKIASSRETIDLLGPSIPGTIGVAMGQLGGLVDDIRYAMQSVISIWIGDTKIRQPRQGVPLFSPNDLATLRGLLEPGDILIERRNWYLSNAFLPRYWPHAALYVGTQLDLVSRGLDQAEDVRKQWERFTLPDSENNERVIIEAVSEGVIATSFEHSVGPADAVAVLRPILPQEEIDAAIARAFGSLGLPYDFEFDFATADSLVCTEVVYRSYGGNSGTLQFPLERILGRTTLPATALVEKYDKERGTVGAQFEFIGMIDGDEFAGTSRFIVDADHFVATAKRPALTRPQGFGLLGTVLLLLTSLCTLVWMVSTLRQRTGLRRVSA